MNGDTFTGISNKGNLQEALNNALAQLPRRGDMPVKWHLDSIEGVTNDLTGRLNELEVTISVRHN